MIEHAIRDTARVRGVGEEQVAREFLRHSQPIRRYVTTAQIGGPVAFPVQQCRSLHHPRRHLDRRQLVGAVTWRGHPAQDPHFRTRLNSY